jgi:hypothetical protein
LAKPFVTIVSAQGGNFDDPVAEMMSSIAKRWTLHEPPAKRMSIACLRFSSAAAYPRKNDQARRSEKRKVIEHDLSRDAEWDILPPIRTD